MRVGLPRAEVGVWEAAGPGEEEAGEGRGVGPRGGEEGERGRMGMRQGEVRGLGPKVQGVEGARCKMGRAESALTPECSAVQCPAFWGFTETEGRV